MSDVVIYLHRIDGKSRRTELLLKAAELFTGTDTSSWHKVKTELGKPYFAEAPKLAFSVSHSEDYWACAFGEDALGLDLQFHQNCPRERLAHRFFHPEEDAWLRSQGYDDASFFRIWTAKESWIKRTGDGLSAGLENFSVLSPLPDGSVLHYLCAPTNYTMCLCTVCPVTVSTVMLEM